MSTPAKKICAIRQPVANWLERAQRMAVKMDLDEGTDPASTKLEGTQTVDLVPSGTYEYVVKFKAFKEGACGARVTFTNPDTGEYLFHDLKVTVEEPNTLEVIKLEAPLRQTTRHLITVDNPLASSAAITFSGGDEQGGWWTCPDPTVRLTQVGEMQGNKEGTFQLKYRPLLTRRRRGEAVTEVPLEFKIDELGTYKYTLQLKPMPPTSEPTLRFEAPLGASQTETFTFRAFNRSAVSFACSVSQPMFFQVAEPSKAADACADWEGQDVKVQVRFEPEKLGNIDDVLVVDGGAEAGEYRVRLAGVCRRPQPQGPFDVPGGGSKDIAVRNVYATDREYVFTVDNPAFAVGAAKATIKAKDSSNCSVKYTPSDGAAGGVETGKLFVSCPAVPDMPPWIFYLRGVSS